MATGTDITANDLGDELADLPDDQGELLKLAVAELRGLRKAIASSKAELLRRSQAAALLDISVASFARYVASGRLPAGVRVGGGAIRWRRSDLMKAIEKMKS